MVPTGLAIFFLIKQGPNSQELNEFEKAKLQNEVLVSRSTVREPERDFSISRQRAYPTLLVAEGKTDTRKQSRRFACR
ncbi:MAG: hypothetical protein Ct9H300mP7_2890 [Verrucomicrobiota bacterium]|nr:MAG: hypothetical protein Ct9H300mP7_2890 [Verrucomicrobiota bacterium]